MERALRVEVFHSFEEENETEYHRRAQMTHQERCQELAVLQERMWGEKWRSGPIIKNATWEKLTW